MSWPDKPITVRVPATGANLGPGFDSLGMALSLHDVVRAGVTAGGLSIEVTGAGEMTAADGEDHLVIRAMRAAFGVAGRQPPGLAVRCDNAIPHGFGLGSSAAAIISGLLAARGLCGECGTERLPDEVILRLAADLEGHVDNVAACLRGGLTVAWGGEQGGPVRCARLDPLPGLTVVVCLPAEPLSTKAARAVLPAMVPLADAARNAGRSALMVAALTTDPSLLLDATEDFLHQPYRAPFMPETARLVAAMRESGIAAVVSGAGPAVLALFGDERAAGSLVAKIASEAGPDWTVRALDIDRVGAAVS